MNYLKCSAVDVINFPAEEGAVVVEISVSLCQRKIEIIEKEKCWGQWVTLFAVAFYLLLLFAICYSIKEVFP